MIAVPVYIIVANGGMGPIGGDGFTSVPVLLVVLGCFVTVLFALGCCGLMKRNRCLVMTVIPKIHSIKFLELSSNF